MEKDTLYSNNEDANFLLKKDKEEVLEISSTGYGLETVIKESKKRKNHPSCGGL